MTENFSYTFEFQICFDSRVFYLEIVSLVNSQLAQILRDRVCALLGTHLIALPFFLIPHFQTIEQSGNRHVLPEVRIFFEIVRNENAPLTVHDGVHCTSKHESNETSRGRFADRHRSQSRCKFRPRLHGIDEETLVQAARHDNRRSKLSTE